MKFCSEFCCILTHFHSNLGSRGGKYSGLTKAEICKKYRESLTEAKKGKITNQKTEMEAKFKGEL